MTEQKEVYMIVHESHHGDCCFPHVIYCESLEQAQASLGDFDYAGGTVVLIKGVKVAQREVGLYPEVG